MNKRESKRDHILWSGLKVMMCHGYNGTSVKDIVDAAAVPKGSFYNYFESKESFAVDALEAVSCKDYLSSRELLSTGDKSPLRRLQNFFEQSALRARQSEYRVGCFIGNMGQEMSDSNEAIRHKVREILIRNTQLFADVLEQAKEVGEIPGDAQTGVIAEFILNAWEGALMRMKASKSRESLDAFLKMLPQIAK